MGKGEDTKRTILDAGLEVAASEGLEALSIGRLADRVGMSKSGLFAHFRSKEALQLEVLQHGRAAFAREVVGPAMAAPRGLPRLRALTDRWLGWTFSEERESGCLFLQAAAEYDDREGAVRDLLVSIQRDLIEFLERAAALCVEEGHLREDTLPDQLAYELHGLVMAHHFHTRLLQDPGAPARTRAALERLLASHS